MQNKGGSTVVFDLGLVLLLVKIDPVAKKRRCKKHAFRIHGTERVKMILALSTKIVALYMCTLVVEVGILGLESSIPKGEICLAMLLALDKQF